MGSLLIRWLVTTLAILLVPYLVPGVQVDSFGSALAAAAILGVLNFLVRPVLIILTLPLTILSFGFFLLVINAILFDMMGSIVRGVHVAGFGSAFLAGLVVTVVTWAMHLGRHGHRVV